ncbi:DUF362 domain-containing protein [Kosmotoga arenicorallina]|uniref:DUF362 domain-containing protein n=1 Tax=Kosmotoga arenicorallina TaxID=688066 RepID=UPI000A043DE4|nr:DUF362 domain-containing protein [Kosmotoga arenicorallina]
MTRVIIKRCPDYSFVKEKLQESFENLGIENLFTRGEKVLLKPNLLTGREPEAAVTTHPLFLSAVIELFQDMGLRLSVGDSPVSGNTRKAAAKSGIEEVCKKYGVELVTFTDPKKSETSYNTRREFKIAKQVLEADSVVNLPKLKTHSLMTLTLAVKNTFGCIVGSGKQLWHIKAVSRESFAKMLIELHEIINPKLNILDGVVGMHGNGPANGKAVNFGIVAVSKNGFALDDAISQLYEVPAEMVPTIFYARRLGITPKYELQGDSPKPIHLKLPDGIRLISKSSLLSRLVSRVPFIDGRNCIRCKECEMRCPASAISIEKQKIDYSKCIKCYVCHEVCQYDAIKLKRKFILQG